MEEHQHKSRISLHAIFTLAALVILVDFVMPGRIIHDEIIDVQQRRQQYYNAARNYHYTYTVITREHEFLVAEDFAQLARNHEKIEYSVSRIFKEINWYRLFSSDNKSFYSLRIASGLVLPLLTISSILVIFRYKRNMVTIAFILRILLIADLIFLMT